MYEQSLRVNTKNYGGESVKQLEEGGNIVCKDKRSSWDLIEFPRGILSGRNLPLYYNHTSPLHTIHGREKR